MADEPDTGKRTLRAMGSAPMTEHHSGFMKGLLIGAVVTGVIVWWVRAQAVENAESRASAIEKRINEQNQYGSDERLQYLEAVSAGNGTVYLYDSGAGRVWMIAPTGVMLIPSPPAKKTVSQILDEIEATPVNQTKR